jgi:hypothetical protein
MALHTPHSIMTRAAHRIFFIIRLSFSTRPVRRASGPAALLGFV